MNSLFYDKNMLALTSKNSNLAIRLGTVGESEKILFKISKNGSIIPVLKKDGHERPLHSTIDPDKEGLRYYKSFKASGFIVFLGLGAAYHINPFINQTDISEILIIDKDLELFKSLIIQFDLTQLILNPRVKFLIDPDVETVKNYLLSNYLPAVSGNLHILNLRSRIITEEIYFNTIIHTIESLIGSLSEDFSVQSHFGKRWFINTLSNLEKAQNVKNILPPIKSAMVTGAGPSLEKQLPEILNERNNRFLIATDTSLPFLLKNSIEPDIVISIDCQHITFHHFLAGLPQHIPLVLDLASPAWLTRRSKNIVFFTSGHPFSQYVNTRWRSFPYIDTSGGNVSHAAISLADKLGAKEIYLYGIDFSYPNGKSYARGTYLYPYFNSDSNRFHGLENSFVSFLFFNQKTVKQNKSYGISYTTTPMISYKKRLEKASTYLDAQLIQVDGLGENLVFPKKQAIIGRKNNITPFFSAGSSAGNWQDFLKNYRTQLKNLPKPGTSLSEYFEILNSDQKDICTTLYPSSAALRRSGMDRVNGAEILNYAIEWTIREIKNYIL